MAWLDQPWFLGILAGATVFLGFPIARLRNVSTKTKALLNAISTGILIFLLVEITGHLLEGIEEMIKRVAVGQPGIDEVIKRGFLFVSGFSIGLLGLVYFERRFLGSAKDLAPSRRSRHTAVLIAVGLGLHNFSEGLAIGQGLAGGAMHLAWLLAIGFALHNATEGFGIAAPLSGHQVSWRFLSIMGLVAGGPTFIGAVVGSWWTNKAIEIFCLALASGTILYVVGELLHLGRKLKEETVVEVGLLAGFFVAVITDFVLIGAMTHGAAQQAKLLPGTETPVHIQSLEDLHKPRHGGYFGDADDVFHYELLVNDRRQLILYVNDDLNRPLDVRAYEGQWRLNPDEPAQLSGSFHPAPDGAYFIGEIPPMMDEVLHVEVAVQKGSQWAPMEFYLPIPSQNASEIPAENKQVSMAR